MQAYPLRNILQISHIYSFYYRELSNDYLSAGFVHPFWKMAYLDKGRLSVKTDLGQYELYPGDLIFYKPHLFHRGQALAMKHSSKK